MGLGGPRGRVRVVAGQGFAPKPRPSTAETPRVGPESFILCSSSQTVWGWPGEAPPTWHPEPHQAFLTQGTSRGTERAGAGPVLAVAPRLTLPSPRGGQGHRLPPALLLQKGDLF
uniref:Uncharacterized protein n=1 Tax=Theropithecus gelada TaxID=9565 RepID=A0A8D2F958_THEGE